MEIYLNRLIEIVSAESSVQSSYEHKEMVLELLVRLYKIPGEFFTFTTVDYMFVSVRFVKNVEATR